MLNGNYSLGKITIELENSTLIHSNDTWNYSLTVPKNKNKWNFTKKVKCVEDTRTIMLNWQRPTQMKKSKLDKSSAIVYRVLWRSILNTPWTLHTEVRYKSWLTSRLVLVQDDDSFSIPSWKGCVQKPAALWTCADIATKMESRK